MRRILLTAASALAAAGLSGCGRSDASTTLPSTVPVKGKVTYQGRPLDRGLIKFEPDGAGREAHGTIGKDGSFTLSTYAERDGAVPGLHRVAISGAPIPPQFRNLSASGVEVEVSAGKGEYAIDLK